MILAAVGAVAGLFFFFHGFSLLQEQRLAPACVVSKAPVHTATITTTTTFTAKGGDALKRDAHAEVIQLSPADSQPNGSASMTQQGKIAAALLKAGIPNPVTLSDNRAQTAVRVADFPANEKAATQEKAVAVSRVLQQGANAAALGLPALHQDSGNWMPWKTSLMIWGGPALTLACIYALAAHFGWL
ncbi:MAG: hypothetical protein WA628_24405 [Terriglobales bacterium]